MSVFGGANDISRPHFRSEANEMKEWWHSWWWIMLAGLLFLFSFVFTFLYQEVY